MFTGSGKGAGSEVARGGVNHAARVVAGALTFAILIALAGIVPAIRRELRRSFTRLPARYTELYFTRSPYLQPSQGGLAAVVPVSVVDHDRGPTTHRIIVWITTAAGPIAARSTTTLEVRRGRPASTVVRLPIAGSGRARVPLGSRVVFVALAGHRQRLHYRLKEEELA